MYFIVYPNIWLKISISLCHRFLSPLSLVSIFSPSKYEKENEEEGGYFSGELLSLYWPILRSNFPCQSKVVIKSANKGKECMSYFPPSPVDSYFLRCVVPVFRPSSSDSRVYDRLLFDLQKPWSVLLYGNLLFYWIPAQIHSYSLIYFYFLSFSPPENQRI